LTVLQLKATQDFDCILSAFRTSFLFRDLQV